MSDIKSGPSLRRRAFLARCKERGWDSPAKIAANTGIPESSLSKVLRGQMGPGSKFIDATLLALGPESYHEVFDIRQAAGWRHLTGQTAERAA